MNVNRSTGVNFGTGSTGFSDYKYVEDGHGNIWEVNGNENPLTRTFNGVITGQVVNNHFIPLSSRQPYSAPMSLMGANASDAHNRKMTAMLASAPAMFSAQSRARAQMRQLQDQMAQVTSLRQLGVTEERIMLLNMPAHRKAVIDNLPTFRRMNLVKEDDDAQTEAISMDTFIQIARRCGGNKALSTMAEKYTQLKQKGFKLDEIARLANRDSGGKLLDTLLARMDELLKVFGKPQILTMACTDGRGSKTIETVLRNLDVLMQHGLDVDDIAKTARYGGGQGLESLLKNLNTLEQEGFKKEDIFKMARYGGASAIKFVIENLDALRKKDLNEEEIAQIAGEQGGAQALDILLLGWDTLSLRLTKKELVAIASSKSSGQTLQILMSDKWNILIEILGKKNLVDITSKLCNAQTLEKILTCWDVLRQYLTKDQLAKIAKYPGSAEVLEILATRWNELTQLMNKDQIARIARYVGGAQTLKLLLARWNELHQLLNTVEIVNIASSYASSQALTILLDYWDVLNQRIGDKQKLIDIARRHLGGATLELLVFRWNELSQRLSAEQITEIALGDASAATLEMILDLWEDLVEKGLDADEITTIAARWRGAEALNAALAGQPLPADDNTDMEDVQPVSLAPMMKRDASQTLEPESSKQQKTQEDEEFVPIKNEPGLPVVDVAEHGYETERLNTAQTLYTPTTSYTLIDLEQEGGPQVGVLTLRDPDNAMIVAGRQKYDPELDKRFPIRDPKNPTLVHPDYADPDDPTRCAPSVRLKSVRFYKGGSGSLVGENDLWRMARENFDTRTPYPTKELFLEALYREIEAELKATMRNSTPPSSSRICVVPVEDKHCDSEEEAQAMRKEPQDGVVPTNYAETAQPSIRNAKIVCLWGASKLASKTDDAAYEQTFGKELAEKMGVEYGAFAKQFGKKVGKEGEGLIQYAPWGGGNVGQYINSNFAEAAVAPPGFEKQPAKQQVLFDKVRKTFDAVCTLLEQMEKNERDRKKGVDRREDERARLSAQMDKDMLHTLIVKLETEYDRLVGSKEGAANAWRYDGQKHDHARLRALLMRMRRDGYLGLVSSYRHCNAELVSLLIELIDAKGNVRKETLLVVIQTKNVAEGKQIKEWYGEGYVLKQAAQEMESDSDDLDVYIKEEPASPQ